MSLVHTLIDCAPQPTAPVLSQALRELYDGELHFPGSPTERPYVIANFVSTLDGVVSYQLQGQSGGSAISGSNHADRFIMGLLRASVDAILVGRHSVHDVSPESLWTPEYTYADSKQLFADYRLNVLHKPPYPLVVVVSGSGRLDLARAVFRTPEVRTVVITSPAGQRELLKHNAIQSSCAEIYVIDASGARVDSLSILRTLRSEFGVEILLSEGGPTVFGQFLSARSIDELFLTLSPQAAGRTERSIRPGLVSDLEFLPSDAPWFQLLSVKQQSEYLYLRYRCCSAR